MENLAKKYQGNWPKAAKLFSYITSTSLFQSDPIINFSCLDRAETSRAERGIRGPVWTSHALCTCLHANVNETTGKIKFCLL